jgi:hypothetical protein
MIWTVADVEDLEAVCGIDFADLAGALESSTAGGKLRITAALLWLRRRRTDPTFTFEDARAMPVDALQAAATELAAATADPPTEGGA